MNLASDNTTGICPEILEAIEKANKGSATSYGADSITENLTRKFSELFECDLQIFPVSTGSAANAIALSTFAQPWSAIYCHKLSHIDMDECGGPEFYTGGAKLITSDGADAKILTDEFKKQIESMDIGDVHMVQPSILSLTQITEAGTAYSVEEVKSLCDAVRSVTDEKGKKMFVHMDGARFANAVAYLDKTPAEITWKSGVDLLSFGATKNGAMAAEAVIAFKPSLSNPLYYQSILKDELPFRRKRGGHLISKMRFLSAQLDAYITDDLWLKNARHANAMAKKLYEGIKNVKGMSFPYSINGNIIIVDVTEELKDKIEHKGLKFSHRKFFNKDLIRFVTSFDTPEKTIDWAINLIKECDR